MKSSYFRRYSVFAFVLSLVTGAFSQSSAFAIGPFLDCSPITYDNPSGNAKISTFGFDGGYQLPYLCFQIKKVEFNAQEVTLDGKGLLQQVKIYGLFRSTPCRIASSCGNANPALLTNGLGIYLEGEEISNTKSEEPDNTLSCKEFKSNFAPKDSKTYDTIGSPNLNLKNNLAITTPGEFVLNIPIYLPFNCLSGNYHISYFWDANESPGMATLAGIPGNQLIVNQKQAIPVLGKTCKKLKLTGRTSGGENVVCSSVNGKYKWKATTSKPTVTNTSSTPKVGATCSKPGQTIESSSKKFACVLNGKKTTWVIISGSSNDSTSSAKNQQNSGSKSQTRTQADNYKDAFCRTFPAAAIAFQRAELNTNKIGIALSESLYNLQLAVGLDSKYRSLNTAALTIRDFVQAQNKWAGGQGYFGDLNTVRMAMDTVNSSCGSNLYIN